MLTILGISCLVLVGFPILAYMVMKFGVVGYLRGKEKQNKPTMKED